MGGLQLLISKFCDRFPPLCFEGQLRTHQRRSPCGYWAKKAEMRVKTPKIWAPPTLMLSCKIICMLAVPVTCVVRAWIPWNFQVVCSDALTQGFLLGLVSNVVGVENQAETEKPRILQYFLARKSQLLFLYRRSDAFNSLQTWRLARSAGWLNFSSGVWLRSPSLLRKRTTLEIFGNFEPWETPAVGLQYLDL